MTMTPTATRELVERLREILGSWTSALDLSRVENALYDCITALSATPAAAKTEAGNDMTARESEVEARLRIALEEIRDGLRADGNVWTFCGWNSMGMKMRDEGPTLTAYINSALSSRNPVPSALPSSDGADARLAEALRRAVQWVPANAVDTKKAMTHPVAECRTLAFCEKALAEYDAARRPATQE